MTNYELIKSMSIESLAKFINMPISCNDICDDFCTHVNIEMEKELFIDG